jgi:hypothetical protein
MGRRRPLLVFAFAFASRRAARAPCLLFSYGATCWALSCGAFELGDIVPLGPDETSGDAGPGDAPAEAADGGPCVADGGPCSCLPEPFTVSPGPRGVGTDIAVAGGTVYFMVNNFGGGGTSNPVILRVPADGTASPVQMTKPSAMTGPLIVGGASLFLRKTGTAFSVLRVPRDAVGIDPLVDVGPLPFVPSDLAANGAEVYWSNSGAAICQAPVDGAAPPPDPSDSGCGGPPLVPPRDGGNYGPHIALGATSLFATGSTTKIFSVPLATGSPLSPVVQESAPNSISAIAESGGRVFWVLLGNDAGSLKSAADDGTGAQVVVPSLLPGRTTPELVVDGDGVYWAQLNYTMIMAAGRDGSNPHPLACEPAAAIATDATFLYWVNAEGAVKRVAKK